MRTPTMLLHGLPLAARGCLAKACLLACAVLIGTGRGFAFPESPPAAGLERADYLRDVKPVLQARCFACHGALKQKAGLRLDTGTFIRNGGDGGEAVVPGAPEESLLLEKVTAADPAERMPPEGEPLTAEQIARLRLWIQQGAPSPDGEMPEPDPSQHWSFQPPVKRPLPRSAQNPASNPVDAWIGQQLEVQGLTPQPPASKAVRLRRVYLDLVGVPPTADELREFLADESPLAYEAAVDRLLNSPRYGERWARHWMDVWRYSDWYGRRHVPDVWNSASQIWRWRDWIVRSLNDDKGYDRMVQEMLAADEIAGDDPSAAVATGYLVRNWYALNPNDWMRSNVEHTGKAFLGLTFNCAHCHDHKYDPITQEEYFRFRAFFEPLGVRQDRVPGEADPGPFQEYEYSVLRKIQRLGRVSAFDKQPQAPTWFYTGGDERNRLSERGSIPPGVPEFLSGNVRLPPIETVSLPPAAWNPALEPGILETMLQEADLVVRNVEAALQAVSDRQHPPPAIASRLEQAQRAYEDALQRRPDTGGALVGKQSLLLDAAAGRRVLLHGLKSLTALEPGTTVDFECLLLEDAHFNFQLAKNLEQGATAGVVVFDKGRIVSYQPGTVQEFEAGRYDFSAGQARFAVQFRIEPDADRCLLTVQTVPDGKRLVDAVPIALNGWNPVGDPKQGILFDARTGSVAAIDQLTIRRPTVDGEPEAAPALLFDFEPPKYAAEADAAGVDGWSASSFSEAPATSTVTASGADPDLSRAKRELRDAERAAAQATVVWRATQASLTSARAERETLRARFEAERARHNAAEADVVEALIRAAAEQDRAARLALLQANLLAAERALAEAEALPAADPQRAARIQAAAAQQSAAQTALETERNAVPADDYRPLTRTYPKTSTGRRKALALWITSRDNPLTARVAVNHIWARHFHQPLVATVYDFGRNGAPPSHPELLDWLAVEFVESGWSMKHLHRLIVTSAAYQRSSAAGTHTENVARDPENRWLWRMNAGRMEAEVVRDSLLYAAGRLETQMGGQELENETSLKTNRRSLYYAVFPEQGGKSALGELFDGPDALECYRRTRSIVPQQALALTNSDLVHDVSRQIVSRWTAEQADGPADHDAFIAAMFETILSRPPSEAERAVCKEALEKQAAAHSAAAGSAASSSGEEASIRSARESLVRVLLNHNDFVTIR